MPTFPGRIESRLPRVGTTIFTVMSRLAAECGALNLSQGFPDFSAPPQLFDLVAKHMHAGANQYAPMAGAVPLREAIAAKIDALYGARYDPEHEITVTAGGTQAIYTAVACLVRPGDEVIVFEPVYDSYVPAIELNGGIAVRAQLRFPDYRPDWAQVRALVTPRTRMIMINTPHNPSGSVWSAQDMAQLADIVRGTDIVIAADEVYEHILFDGARHESCARHPELAQRSFVISSLRQDLSRHRLEGGLRCRAARADGGVPQGAPVHRIHGEHAGAAARSPNGCKMPAATSSSPPSTRPSATSFAPGSPPRASRCCRAPAPTSSSLRMPRSATSPIRNSPSG